MTAICYILDKNLVPALLHLPNFTGYIHVLLQLPVMEISDWNILFGFTSTSGRCLSSLDISAQTGYGPLARFMLGELLVIFGAIRYL